MFFAQMEAELMKGFWCLIRGLTHDTISAYGITDQQGKCSGGKCPDIFWDTVAD